jgi:hypothetical protein
MQLAPQTSMPASLTICMTRSLSGGSASFSSTSEDMMVQAGTPISMAVSRIDSIRSSATANTTCSGTKPSSVIAGTHGMP